MNTEAKLFIIVEGINDIVFIKDFLKIHFRYINNQKINGDTVLLEINDIIIYSTKGKDLDNSKKQNLVQEINKRNPENIIFVFDADDNYKDAKDNIKGICKYNESLKNSKCFLFPDDENIGELEHFLEKIAIKKDIFECWEQFELCISTIENNFTIPAKKSKIHTYLKVLNPNTKKGKDNCKEPNRDYTETTKWNLNDKNIPVVNKLFSFLNQFIKTNNE
jgi:hypothetical protein